MSAKIAAILDCVTEQADMGVYLTTWINTHQLKDDLPQAIACSDCGWTWVRLMACDGSTVLVEK